MKKLLPVLFAFFASSSHAHDDVNRFQDWLVVGDVDSGVAAYSQVGATGSQKTLGVYKNTGDSYVIAVTSEQLKTCMDKANFKTQAKRHAVLAGVDTEVTILCRGDYDGYGMEIYSDNRAIKYALDKWANKSDHLTVGEVEFSTNGFVEAYDAISTFGA
ncbi:hypothetical protein I3271_07285 [Photobacterium leiognathi]|uniref:hypothetical protein n=1 Tax=Photobacterium leiognathi TaxID=553611 RepID=UPI001EE00692|nr:hypothetical protein [Photobacterium leiognathi]MCG3884489.1 hypothetical protein [Photobacterium leiognathi]